LNFMDVRYPAVAGVFYPSDKDSLIDEIRRCFLHPLGPGKEPEHVVDVGNPEVVAYISPHAGYKFSGPIAAHVYYSLSKQPIPSVIVLIGPNHSGLGAPAAIMVKGSWITPLGEVKVHTEVAMSIARNSSYLDVDTKPFVYEHSIEVQLPFIQYVYGSRVPPIVPIVMSLRSCEAIEDVCEALDGVLPRNAIIIATTDWTHYEPYDVARSKDLRALEIVAELDYRKLLEYADRVDLTACGLSAVAIAMCFSKRRGVSKAKILAYATSGDVIGDKTSVVGYAAVEFPRRRED